MTDSLDWTLLTDDEKAFLRDYGFEVCLAANGHEIACCLFFNSFKKKLKTSIAWSARLVLDRVLFDVKGARDAEASLSPLMKGRDPIKLMVAHELNPIDLTARKAVVDDWKAQGLL